MFYFDKKTYYIDYFQGNEKKRNAGFITITRCREEYRIHIGIRNVPKKGRFLCRWFGIRGDERIYLEEFWIEDGRGDFSKRYEIPCQGKTNWDFQDLDGYYFALGNQDWGSCFKENVADILRLLKFGSKDDISDMKAADNSENVAEKEVSEEESVKENNKTEESEVQQDTKESLPPRTTWDELLKSHQVVHPFDNQGDYISINPLTLKMLAPTYRKLANNSFLLHGFYNYRHLILGYYTDEKRQGYYVGVPGTFHEKEQMVAEMFGFEGYEPAGEIGYYMRQVEF